MPTQLSAVVTPPDSDENLMLAYKAGQASAFEQLYRRHKDAVFRYFLRQGLATAVAEELSHDTWLRIINHRENYVANALFKTYLFTIARHIVIDHTQKKSTRQELTELQELAAEEAAEGGTALQQALKQQIAALPFEQRQTFVLKQESGFSIEQIAEMTQQSKEKVKSSWRYALQKLRQGLSQYVD